MSRIQNGLRHRVPRLRLVYRPGHGVPMKVAMRSPLSRGMVPVSPLTHLVLCLIVSGYRVEGGFDEADFNWGQEVGDSDDENTDERDQDERDQDDNDEDDEAKEAKAKAALEAWRTYSKSRWPNETTL